MKLPIGLTLGAIALFVHYGLESKHPELILVSVLVGLAAIVFTVVGVIEKILNQPVREKNLHKAQPTKEAQSPKRKIEIGQSPNLNEKTSEIMAAQLPDSGLALEMDKLGVFEGQDALQNIAGVYVVANDEDGRFKIGQTGNFEKRFPQLQKIAWAAGVRDIRPVCLFPMNEERESIERSAHFSLLRYRVSGEWFKCDEETAIRAVINAIPERRGYGDIQEDIPF